MLQILRYLPHSLYFNFYYLDFKDALHLPILLYKPHFVKMQGNINIINKIGGVRFGMIRLGFNNVSLYPFSGIVWENRGTVVFEGKADIGNYSAISSGNQGHLIFGENFRASCGLKIACYNSISFENDVLIGWDSTITDTDFHALQIDGKASKGYGKVRIGANSWIASQCLILKGTWLPEKTIVAARSVINSDFTEFGTEILIAGNPARFKRNHIYRDVHNDKIEYKISEG